MGEKTRYSDAELEEFKAIILEKLAKAHKEYDELRSVVSNADGNDVNDTSPTFQNSRRGCFDIGKRGSWSVGSTSNEVYPTPSSSSYPYRE